VAGEKPRLKMKGLFLYLYDFPNTTLQADDIIVKTAQSEPSFVPLLLLFVFFVVFLGGIARQKLRIGTADYPMWAVVASLSTFIITLITSVIEGLIRLDWLAIVITVTIFSGIWLFLDRKPQEL